MARARQYDQEFKIQAVKLSQEIGSAKAAKELNIPSNTLYGWTRAYKEGRLDGIARAPENVMTLAEEVTMLRKQVKEQQKKIRRLEEINEFLEEASAFFAASRRKSARTTE